MRIAVDTMSKQDVGWSFKRFSSKCDTQMSLNVNYISRYLNVLVSLLLYTVLFLGGSL